MRFKSETELLALADRIWRKECRLEDYFEAFDQHPRITAKAKKSSPKVISALEMGIKAYERKFGFPFIVVPTRKPTKSMLALLQERLKHDEKEEIIVVIEEQRKIIRSRLKKLLS